MEPFLSEGSALCGLLQLWHQQLVKPRTKSMCKETSYPVSHVFSNWKSHNIPQRNRSSSLQYSFQSLQLYPQSCCWLVDGFFLNNSIFPHRSYFLTNTEKIVNKEWRNQERIILPTNKKKKKAFCSHYLALEYREVISSDALASSISITTHSWTIWKIIDLFCRPKTDSRPIPQGAMTEPELLSIRNQSKMEIRYCKWLSSLTVLSLCISVICSTS